MKFTDIQWKIYNALKDSESMESFLVLRDFPLGRTRYTQCPLCGYETEVTNIHRNCPLAPLLSNDKFFNGERLGIVSKLASLNMIDVEGKGEQKSGYVPRGWNHLQWRRDITPEQWDEIIKKQDFVK